VSRPRGGMVMLEVILGVAILGLAGVALVTLLAQTVHTVRQGRAAERRTESAVQLLDRATLWSESALASRLGRSRVGDWNLDVATPQAQLFTIAVLDTLAGATVLRTTVYRP
jgi:type II secretory pathway pseudopilin PulG